MRFLVAILGGWMLMRAWLLWPVPILPVDPLSELMSPTAAEASVRPPQIRATPIKPAPRPAVAAIAAGPSREQSHLTPPPRHERNLPGEERALVVAAAPVTAPIPPALPAMWNELSPPSRAGHSRLSGSAWLLLRRGSGAIGALPVSQLGGAQAGVRLAYAIDSARRLAITARLSAPLSGHGREAAVGVGWRPLHAPVELIAEQRLSLDGGRGGPTIGVIAGLNPTPVAAHFRLEAYGQAGAIRRDRVEGFADGAARLARPITTGPIQIDLGVGTWGGVQRDAARLDVGPSIGASLPVAGRHLRLTVDWRERVAGGAQPGSGPALSLGTDF